jgi:ketosteroid isomerase-like protein
VSKENLEVVRRLYDAVGRHDEATVLALYDPEVEFDSSRHPFASLIGGRRVFRGHEGVRSFFRERSEALGNVEDAYEELIDAGDNVVLIGSVRGRGRASGIDVELGRVAGVFAIREARIVRVVWLPTREEALKTVGLADDEGSPGTIEGAPGHRGAQPPGTSRC